jgi:hypothetical protein
MRMAKVMQMVKVRHSQKQRATRTHFQKQMGINLLTRWHLGREMQTDSKKQMLRLMDSDWPMVKVILIQKQRERVMHSRLLKDSTKLIHWPMDSTRHSGIKTHSH